MSTRAPLPHQTPTLFGYRPAYTRIIFQFALTGCVDFTRSLVPTRAGVQRTYKLTPPPSPRPSPLPPPTHTHLPVKVRRAIKGSFFLRLTWVITKLLTFCPPRLLDFRLPDGFIQLHFPQPSQSGHINGGICPKQRIGIVLVVAIVFNISFRPDMTFAVDLA